VTGGRFTVGISRDLRGDDGAPVFDIGLDVLAPPPQIEWEFLAAHEDELSAETVSGYDAIVVFSSAVTARTIAGNERLKLVARLGVGYDRVDLDACSRAGVIVTNAPTGVRRPMAVSAITFVLALAHRLVIKDAITRSGDWDTKWGHIGMGLPGRVLGIVGFGGIGQETARLAQPFGLTCITADPYVGADAVAHAGVRLVPLDELLATSDFVCVTCPLTPETHHLIGAEQLALMRASAYLINVARGPIVDHEALVACLTQRQIAGAALDVFEREPLPPNDPLLALDSVILTPHAIGHTDEMLRDCGRGAFAAVAAVAAGEVPEHVVNQKGSS
jgi:phosphoglycerate dehydrogenase-like enzyme